MRARVVQVLDCWRGLVGRCSALGVEVVLNGDYLKRAEY
jgi:hypothetical protein